MNRRAADKALDPLDCKMTRSSLETSRLLEAQHNALNAEHSNIRSSLDVDDMVQFLNSKFLLTPDEKFKLAESNQPRGKRIDFLVEILPRKGSDWWDKLIQCLDESSTRPGLGAHKELANQLRDQLNQQMKKHEQKRNLMWMPMIKYFKWITLRHQKTAFKIATIMSILIVGVCILRKSNTFIISPEIYSAIDDKSQLGILTSTHDIVRKLVPATNATESEGNITFHESMKTTHNFTHNPMKIHNTSRNTTVRNLGNKQYEAYAGVHIKGQLTNNHTSQATQQKHNKIQSIILNTPGIANQFKSAYKKDEQPKLVHSNEQLPTSQPDDVEIMQRQLHLTQCLLFYIEKEKMEHAELDLWRIYTTLKAIPPNITTATEKYIISETEHLTGWDIHDVTINKKIITKLVNTTNTVKRLKNFLSITDVGVIRTVQHEYKFDDQLLSKQLLTNYKSEIALLNLKYKLCIWKPPQKGGIAELLYYPQLQRYVILLVDTLSARTACLKVRCLL